MKISIQKYMATLLLITIYLAGCKKNLCDDQYCLNAGICSEGICECPIGYIGNHCEIAYCDSNFLLISHTILPDSSDVGEIGTGGIKQNLSVGCCDTIVNNQLPDYQYIWMGPSGFTGSSSKDIFNVKYGWYNVIITCESDSLEKWYWVNHQR